MGFVRAVATGKVSKVLALPLFAGLDSIMQCTKNNNSSLLVQLRLSNRLLVISIWNNIALKQQETTTRLDYLACIISNISRHDLENSFYTWQHL